METSAHLVHGDDEGQFGLVEDTEAETQQLKVTTNTRSNVPRRAAPLPAGVQHVGHEGDGADAARRVHHVDHHTREAGRLKRTTGVNGSVAT